MRRRSIAILFFLATVVPAWSQVIVFDPTNYGETTVAAAQSIRQVQEQVKAYALRLKQYETQLKQLKSISPGTVLNMMGQNNVEMQRAIETAQVLESMYGSVQDVKRNFDKRLTEAKLMGMAWDKYVTWEQKRIQANVESAVDRAREEFKVMERVKRDLDYARTMEGSIISSAGIHESMQQVNLNLNRVLTQGADMARMLSGAAMASGVAVEQAQQQNEDDALALERMKAIGARSQSQRESERRALQGLK